MKKSYHSMVVPMVAAITALRSSALWRRSGGEWKALAVTMGGVIPNRRTLLRASIKRMNHRLGADENTSAGFNECCRHHKADPSRSARNQYRFARKRKPELRLSAELANSRPKSSRHFP